MIVSVRRRQLRKRGEVHVDYALDSGRRMTLSDGEEALVGKPSFGLFLELRCCVGEERPIQGIAESLSNTQSSGMRSGRGTRGAGAGRTPVFHEERSRRKHALPQWKRAPGRCRPVSLTPFSLSTNTETTHALGHFCTVNRRCECTPAVTPVWSDEWKA